MLEEIRRHELRTPLAGIIGVHNILVDDPGLGPDACRYVALAHDAGLSLLAIVNDILDLSKVEDDGFSLDRAPFDPADVIASCRAFAVHTARDKPVVVTAAIDTPVVLDGDGPRFRQIVTNLVGNAVKFTENGRVAIEARYDTTTALLTVVVADTGIGMNADAIDTIFDRFSQADASIARRFGGTGLGLAITKTLVALMGGTIDATSIPGHGSTFTVVLPLPPAAAPGPRPSPAADALATRSLRVLVADDNPLNRVIVETMLTQRGHAVVTATDGREAVTTIEAATRSFDAVLMDLQMPVLDGLAATREIRAAERLAGTPPLRIVGFTANTTSAEGCRIAGMDGHLAKPVGKQALFDAIETTDDARDGFAADGRTYDHGTTAVATTETIATHQAWNQVTYDGLVGRLGRARVEPHLDRIADDRGTVSGFHCDRHEHLRLQAAIDALVPTRIPGLPADIVFGPDGMPTNYRLAPVGRSEAFAFDTWPSSANKRHRQGAKAIAVSRFPGAAFIALPGSPTTTGRTLRVAMVGPDGVLHDLYEAPGSIIVDGALIPVVATAELDALQARTKTLHLAITAPAATAARH